MNRIWHILNELIFKIRLRVSSYNKYPGLYAAHYGITMGKNVIISGKIIWGTEPYLITIGDDVRITAGVTFHNHDGGVGILRAKYPDIDIVKPIKIGNNVFIGSNSDIMPGVTIGDNVIIGASSMVTKDIPSNVVAAGVPAKVIKSLEEYEAKVLKDAMYIKRGDLEFRKKEILKNLSNK